MTFQEKVMYGKWTYERLKDEVHSKSLELEEKEKQYNELSNTAMQLDKLVKEKQQEIERSNNIINELEKYCNEEIEEGNKALEKLSAFCNSSDTESYIKGQQAKCKHILDKLQELKGE